MKRKSWMSRMGIVVIAAIMVEAISIVQYERINSIMVEEGQVVQENEADEFHARLQTVRRHQVGLVLLGLAALAFMIRRYAHSEQKLRKADEENARIGAELKVANDIQQSMLPPRQFQQDEVEIFASLVPAREVGGDLFDYYVRDGKLFFCIGDVSGKGAAAAILMSATLTLFRSLTGHENNPARIMDVINKSACRRNDNNMFVTLFVGVLDLSTGELRYCNAGHDRPLVLQKEVTGIEAKPHLPVGVFEDVKYAVQECFLAADSTLLLYTDGLTEAKNTSRAQFGLPRVKETLEEASGKRPEEIIQALTGSLKQFVGSAEQSDDLTLMAIRFSPKSIESPPDALL